MMEPDEVRRFTSRKIHDTRKGQNLDQETLAARMQTMGCSWHPTTVSAIERGGRALRAEELPALAIALRIRVLDLLPALEAVRAR